MDHINSSSEQVNLYGLWIITVRRWRLLTAIFVTTVASTAVVCSLLPKVYRGEALLNVLRYEEYEMPGREAVQAKEIVEAKELVDMIGIIDREKRTKILPTTNRSVEDIKLRAIKDSRDKIIVSIDASTAGDIPKALKELVDYVKNFDIVKLTVMEEKEKLLEKSNELSLIIQTSRNLSETYRKLLEQGKLMPVGFNPVDLNKRIADIKLEKLSVDQRLRRVNGGGIEIAKQPYIQDKPVRPKIMLNVMIAAMASILFFFFLVVFLDYIERLKKKESP